MRPGMFVPILLDPLTLFISNALIYLALTLALGITSRLAPDILAIRLWMRAYGLMALGLSLMVAMSQLLPSWPPQRLLISMLIISGQLLVLAGMRHFFGLRPLPLGLKVAYLFSLAGLVLVKIWGILLFQFLLPLCQIRIPRIIADIVITVGYIGWCLFRLYASGMALGEIVTTSAVITAVIAFSMQDTLGNLLAGVSIQLDNSIAIGDWLQVETTQGRVVEINWRATTIETRNWETVVIPNSHLLKQRFTVLGRRQNAPLQWRRWVWFDITLDTLPTQIIALIEKSLRETKLPCVAKHPQPDCLLMNVEGGIARYAVRYWLTDLARDDPTDSMVRSLIDAALRRNRMRTCWEYFSQYRNFQACLSKLI